MRRPERAGAAALLPLLLLLWAAALAARADDLGTEQPEPWEVSPDPILRDLTGDAISVFAPSGPAGEPIDPASSASSSRRSTASI